MSETTHLSRSQRRKGWIIAGAFAVMVVYLVVSHARPGAAILGCPFRWLTGLSCFGCGMTRSTAHFIHGDLGAALRYHPFGPVFAVAFATTALHHAIQSFRGVRLDYAPLRWWRRIEKPAYVAAAVFLGLFGLVRFVGELTGFLTPI